MDRYTGRRAKIIDLRQKPLIQGDQGNFKDTVRLNAIEFYQLALTEAPHPLSSHPSQSPAEPDKLSPHIL